jgi:predicted HD phosphohydrolase
LSDPSKISLELQGGIMNDEEAQKFTSLKFYKDAIILRKYDDDGKIPNIKMKKIDDYRDLITSQLSLQHY